MHTHATAPMAYAAPSLRILDATDAELGELRELFRRHRFTFGELFRRGEQLSAAGDDAARVDAEQVTDGCDVLRLLFVGGGPVAWETVRTVLPAADMRLLEQLGLLRQHDQHPDACLGAVLVCPIAGLWLFADHPYVGAEQRMAAEVVYSPLTTNTQHFMLLLPRTPCDELLELCSGSGVAAIASARLARRTCAVDITERSTRFAALNARLNGTPNVEALQGDLYAPVAGRTFDRVVAHPPYMPAFEQEYIFRDGGADGEQITRRVFAELPAHLRPGGRCYVVCLATDRRDAPLEERVRGWLGEAHEEFDVMVLELQSPRDPTEFYAHRAYDQGGGFAEVEPRHRFFKDHGVTKLVYSTIVVQRHTAPRTPFTIRRKKGPLTSAPHLDWAFAWERVALDPSLPAELLELAPRPSPDMRMQLTYAPRTTGFALVEAQLLVSSPLGFDVDCPPWIPQFLERAVHAKPAREHFAGLVRDRIVDGDVPAERFAGALRDLAGTGAIVFPGLEPPPPDGQLAKVLDQWPVSEPSALERRAAELG